VFILVQCNTSLSKNCVAHSITVVCVRGWIWEKKGLRSLALCAYETSRRTGIFHEFAFDNKTLKTFVEFRICWKRSKFERCRIRIRTSSHLYSKKCCTLAMTVWPYLELCNTGWMCVSQADIRHAPTLHIWQSNALWLHAWRNTFQRCCRPTCAIKVEYTRNENYVQLRSVSISNEWQATYHDERPLTLFGNNYFSLILVTMTLWSSSLHHGQYSFYPFLKVKH